ncbi:MAG: hypothetical protein M3R24_08160 [Chloroflexota bacterium]|nr:hypothetical protein [Chloroflexota bacterium]
MTVEEAARVLNVTTRHMHRYGQGDPPKIRTQTAGRRTLFWRADVEQLAEEQHADLKPRGQMDVLPAGELFDLVRQQQDQLMLLSRRIGELEGQLAQRLLPDDERHIRDQLAMLRAENEQLRALQVEYERLRVLIPPPRRSWWQRLFGSDPRPDIPDSREQ